MAIIAQTFACSSGPVGRPFLLFVRWSSFAPRCCSCVLAHEAATGVGIPREAGARGKASGGQVRKSSDVEKGPWVCDATNGMSKNLCDMFGKSWQVESTDDEESDTKEDWKGFIKPKQAHKERKKQGAANFEETLENESFKGALASAFGGKEKF